MFLCVVILCACITKATSPDVVFQNKCIEDLGCFYTGPPFYHPLHRPISLTPTSNLGTKFLLCTPTSPEGEELIEATEKSIARSSFDPSLPIKVLIPGFTIDPEPGGMIFKMKDAFLNANDYNIVIVNWTADNGSPYPQAVANGRAVGAQVAQLMNFLIETRDVKAENIHIIGHSLGGHLAGWAGERIPNLGRITGLDPAGLYFYKAEKTVRLDATDAAFVDVIHTDGGETVVDGFAIFRPIGHMDFYPNGGRRQPGCTSTSSRDKAVGTVVNVTAKYILSLCDHRRANDYFLESIDNSQCCFLAVWCNSYSDFEKGNCLPQNTILSEMGFHAKKIPGVPVKSKFFLRTSGSSPFCI